MPKIVTSNDLRVMTTGSIVPFTDNGEMKRVPGGWIFNQWFNNDSPDGSLIYTSTFIPETEMTAKECVDCPNKLSIYPNRIL